MAPEYYKAPWAASVKIATGLSCLLLLGLTGWSLFGFRVFIPARDLPLVIFSLGILFGSMLFIIRGYELTDRAVYVKRLLWRTTIDLSGLMSVEANPEAMSKSIRIFGNGGLFSICGAFSNRSLGSYRAYATDPTKAVVLRFKNRVVVITPHDPDKFTDSVNQTHHISK